MFSVSRFATIDLLPDAGLSWSHGSAKHAHAGFDIPIR
jgi:hypothetical protein